MTDHRFELTRRQALGSLGAIGLASAGAGLGTSAYFSDDEPVTNNTVRAGKLNLLVDYATDSNQGSAGDSTNSGTIDGNPGSYSYVIDDVKPGDTGTLAFCPKLVDNEGWLWVGSENSVTDHENGQTEPETEVDATGGDPGDGNGELSEAVQVTVSYCEDISIDSATDEVEVGNEIRELNNPDDYTLADLAKDLKSGFRLDGDASDSTVDPYPASPDNATQTGPCLCIEWEVPTGVGNEIQTDSAKLDFTFAAIQERHNTDPVNPFVDLTVGKGSGFDYNSIQTAVDNASTGDVISVAAGEYSEQVTIGTRGITLVAARGTTPTVDADGSSPAILVGADGVTIDGFEVTSPGGLLGIKVDVGIDDVTICNNRIYDVGPTGSLGVSGIIVGQGDHEHVTIVDNVIENLVQTDDGNFATLNGIIFDADNNSPGTITDVLVDGNTIRNLVSTTAPLGIVVQHDVVDLSIEDNAISGLTADPTIGPDGGFTTFAQGLSIDSQSTAGFDVVGNTIEDVVSEDGFFGEDVKIEPTADVSGIDVRGNNLLSAIGLNNANGANPTVTAEENYWGSSSGPLVIQNNDDDGDVPTGSGQVDLDTVSESAVTDNVDVDPFATGML